MHPTREEKRNLSLLIGTEKRKTVLVVHTSLTVSIPLRLVVLMI